MIKKWSGTAWVPNTTIGAIPIDSATGVAAAYIQNMFGEDGDDERVCRLIAKAAQSGDELTTLGYIEFSHEGAADDQKGQMRIVINDGDDSNAPSKVAVVFMSTGKIDASESLAVLDEDDMASDDAEVLATQQSIKAYADGTGTDFSGLDNNTNGYHVIPGGLIIQWGKESVSASSDDVTVTFDQAFTKCFQVIVNGAQDATPSITGVVYAITNTGFSIRKSATLNSIRYIAIGR